MTTEGETMFANQRFFDAPGVALIAAGQGSYRGPNSPIYGADGSIVAYTTNGGIEYPTRYEVPVGTRLMRFGRNILADLVLQGDWWLDEVELNKVVAFAAHRRIGVSAAIRLLCAVPSEWSSLDIMVQAVTLEPLLAYRGPGNSAVIPLAHGRRAVDGRNATGLLDAQAKPIGTVIGAQPARLAQSPDARLEFVPITRDANGWRIQQLFIPGLGSGDVRRSALLGQGSRFLAADDANRGYEPLFV